MSSFTPSTLITVPYRQAVRTAHRGSIYIAAVAFLALITGQMIAAQTFLTALLGTVFFALANHRQVHPFSRRQRQAIADWLLRRYGLTVAPANLAALTSIEQDPSAQYGTWTSRSTWVEHIMSTGNRLEQVRLVQLNGDWMLYGAAFGHEFPVTETSPLTPASQRGIALIGEAAGEVIANGGFYVVAADRGEGGGAHVTLFEEEKQRRIHLIWTDELRAELWRGAHTQAGLAVYHWDRERVLGLLDRLPTGQVVGLNWDGDNENVILTPEMMRQYVKPLL